jgi:glycosyltransferase involved in cell wall biosynthesis
MPARFAHRNLTLKALGGMNLLFLADVSIQNVIGGAERVLYEQATRLAACGHRVHLITRRLPEHRSECETIGGVEEIRCGFDRSGSPAEHLRSWRRVREVWAALSAHTRFDAVNIHQPVTAYGLLPNISADATPWVYTCHSLSDEEYLSRHPGRGALDRSWHRIQAVARKSIERRVIGACGHVIVLSDYTRAKLARSHRSTAGRVRVIPGGVDLERFRPATDKAAVRRRLAIPEGRFVLLTVRNLFPRMGIANLVEAFHSAAKKAPELILVIGGEGPLRRPLEEKVAALRIDGRVRFTGFIPEAELAAYFQAADLFVLPTADLEGFGMVTLEALASGLPVIGTPVGGTVEILSRLDPRLLLDDIRPESIAQGILSFRHELVASESSVREWSQRCRRFVESNYSWERNIGELKTLFASCAQSGNIPRTGLEGGCHR